MDVDVTAPRWYEEARACPLGQVTCTEKCHEMLVDRLEREFGIHKKVIDLETGKIYRVSTRDIIEGGFKQQDLKYYPECARGDCT